MKKRKFSVPEKILLILLGGITVGVMWRTRGEHGWGSSWGVLTTGVVFAMFIYYVFARKNNASFFHIGVAAVSMMLTTPAWGPLLHQICGVLESTLTDDTLPCTPASGIFMMLCLGFATPAFFVFFISRLFSDRVYKWYHYAIIIAVPMAVYYISEATLSHVIVGLVQPEVKKALADGITAAGLEGTPYSIYMEHFNSVSWAKKHLAYGRTYFTEIATVSRAVAALAEYITVRFALKDKTGGRITLAGCACMAVAITVPDLFFLFEQKYPEVTWLSSAWSFWEYFTGFLFGILFTAVLFFFHEKTEDAGAHEKHLGNLPPVAKDIFHAGFTFIFTLCLTVFRPIAERFDASDTMKILTYIIGGAVSAVFAVMMLTGKMKKLWRIEPAKLIKTVFPLYFGVQAFIYLFSGDSECIRNIYERGPVLYLMLISYVAFAVLYFATSGKKDEQNAPFNRIF